MRVSRLSSCFLGVLAVFFALSLQAATVTLTGTIRDFCFVPIAGPDPCAVVFHKDSPADPIADTKDFEGPIVAASGMVAPLLGPGGLPLFVAPAGTGVADADSFAKWYTTLAGVNKAAPSSLTLTETPAGSGIFTFSSGAFFPIDGMLFGDQGLSHNYHFTLHLEGSLSFSDPTAGPDFFFSFTGDDDLWIFVGGKLFIDLGGVHGAFTGSFTEETLKAAGLVAGTSYDLDIFFAERHTSASTFAITTTLAIAPPAAGTPEPHSVFLVGIGLLGLAVARVRRG